MLQVKSSFISPEDQLSPLFESGTLRRNPGSAARAMDVSSQIASPGGASPPFRGSAKKVRKFLEPLGQIDGFARNKQQRCGLGFRNACGR